MKQIPFIFAALVGVAQGAHADAFEVKIDSHAGPLESLAAREVVRYFYVRTGEVLPIHQASKASNGPTIFVASKSRSVVRKLHLDAKTRVQVARLKPQEYVLHRSGKTLLVIGGDEVGTLYGAYRLAEHLGVRFYLHGDTIPDGRIPLALPSVEELGKPLFALRGIQPFHDFPEGPDWWTRDDYLSIIGQLPKLRMNFIGFHTYPEGTAGPEPLVWIGQPTDVRKDGRVAFSYPSQWASTRRVDAWGYKATPTSAFGNGASQLFAGDDYGPETAGKNLPVPVRTDACNAVFDATGRMLRSAFGLARALGVKTCVGTETPLTVPKAVQERLQKQGKNPADLAVIRELYRGIFTRIQRACLADYYWLWTPENWTWGGNTSEQFQAVVNDLNAAQGALKDLGHPMALATSGWVLGPQNDRAALDRVLPKSVPVSTINRDVGFAPVERGFQEVKGRSKWSIPWLENDPALAAPQLWAGRMRYDAADSYRLGCDGLFGIHWRTKAMAFNVASLAGSAWDHAITAKSVQAKLMEPLGAGAHGGSTASFSESFAGTQEQAIYQTCRYGMDEYDLLLPNGSYTLTLKFTEPFHDHVGDRVFSVLINGKSAIQDLDILARVGKNRALDFEFKDQVVSHGRLNLRFISKSGQPMICGIVVSGTPTGSTQVLTRRINCGGPAVLGYEADDTGNTAVQRGRSLPVKEFYIDFAKTNFGANVGGRIGQILASVDGVALPEPAAWLEGPGAIKLDTTPWAKTKLKYAFVDKLRALGKEVQGPGNRERFDYWLETFEYMRAMGEAGCLRGKLDLQMKALAVGSDKRALAREALATRLEMARVWDRMMTHMLQTVSTAGELGTVSNLEQHVLPMQHFLSAHDVALSQALGSALPPAAEPGRAYLGKPRLVVTTVRTMIDPGEKLTLPVLLQGGASDPKVRVMWRRIGDRDYHSASVSHVGRGVYKATLPRIAAVGLEYYVAARGKGGESLRFPATAPTQGQTVIVGPTR